MRAFVALALPAAVRGELAAVAEQLRGLGDVRCTAQEQMHVTLQFLGDINARQGEGMRDRLARAQWPRPSLRLAGLGQFPERGPPRVLWAGLDGDVAALAAIADELAAAAAALSVPVEQRPFRAHITLGRCRSQRGSARLQQMLREQSLRVAGPPFAAERVVLYRSDPGDNGSVYTELARAEFA